MSSGGLIFLKHPAFVFSEEPACTVGSDRARQPRGHVTRSCPDRIEDPDHSDRCVGGSTGQRPGSIADKLSWLKPDGVKSNLPLVLAKIYFFNLTVINTGLSVSFRLFASFSSSCFFSGYFGVEFLNSLLVTQVLI